MNEVVCVIHAISSADMEQQIEEAVVRAQRQSTERRREGIVITRHSHSHFTVELDSDIPYGETHEGSAQGLVDSLG